jgi:hypothetical protein
VAVRAVAMTMRRAELSRSSPITGVRVATLIIIWLAVVSLAAPPFGFYYETLAAWYTVPLLGLTYAYCVAHRRRATALPAVVATVVAVLVVGFAIVIPKATTAVGWVSVTGVGGARAIGADDAARAGVDLGRLPADAPPPAITSGAAVALASAHASGGPDRGVLLGVARGRASESAGSPVRTVWAVAYGPGGQVPMMSPQGGFETIQMQIVLIDDQSGAFIRTYTRSAP